MKNPQIHFAITVVALALLAGCAHKKVAQVTPPAPPPPPAPAVSLTANPPAVQAGQPVLLSWKSENASTVTLEGIGNVAGSGTRTVTPQQSTSYVITAQGPGGTKEASARVTVNQPATAAARAPEPSLQAQFDRMVKDIYFDYDRYEIRADQQTLAQAAAEFLAAHPELKVTVEGHCDDRGSEEYNLALGDSRANALRTKLLELGAKGNQVKTVSYGKEKPFCSEENEQCWRQNRRDHYALSQGQ